VVLTVLGQIGYYVPPSGCSPNLDAQRPESQRRALAKIGPQNDIHLNLDYRLHPFCSCDKISVEIIRNFDDQIEIRVLLMQEINDNLVEELRARGMRVTPQRAIIFEAIENLEGHITAEDIFQEVQQVNPYISLATVYRTLELLQELKLVNQTNFGRSQTYFALKDHGPHHHLVCRKCGQIEEFEDELLEPFRAQLNEQFGFQAHTEHMCIFGVCKACQQQK
jgi:Fur family ferric uptake transcriptional regulator